MKMKKRHPRIPFIFSLIIVLPSVFFLACCWPVEPIHVVISILTKNVSHAKVSFFSASFDNLPLIVALFKDNHKFLNPDFEGRIWFLLDIVYSSNGTKDSRQSFFNDKIDFIKKYTSIARIHSRNGNDTRHIRTISHSQTKGDKAR